MDLLEPDDEPLTFHEDIIKYLREQDLLDGEGEQFLQKVSNFKEEHVKEILEELLQKFERNQKLKDDYEERVEAHNQRPLFDLKEVLPDFHMDEEMYEALTFRETLIVQRLVGENELVPEAVGGLCLDIQKVPGKPPAKRLCCDIDTRLARVMKSRENPDVISISDIQTHTDTSTCESGNEDLGRLEDNLQTQSARSLGKFLVHLSSQLDYDGCNAGSSITTWVDWNFHTLEEARKEFYTKKVTKLVEKVEKVIKNTSYASEDKLSQPESRSKTQKEASDTLPKVGSASDKARRLSQAVKTSSSALKTSKISILSNSKTVEGKVGGASKSSRINASKSTDSRKVNILKSSESVQNQARSSMSHAKTTDSQSSRRMSAKTSNQIARKSMGSVAGGDSRRTSTRLSQMPRESLATKISSKLSRDGKALEKESVGSEGPQRVETGASPQKPSSKESGKETREKGEEYYAGPEENDGEVTEMVEDTVLVSKNLYVGLLKGYYYVKYASNDDGIDDRKFYSLQKAKFYISEGANFILQRYLAKTIYIGTFELSTMYINGDMCRNIYNCTGPESQFINNKRVDICRIYRTIIEECGVEHHCMTVLTLQGQIVTQTWEESNYLLQINPLLDIDNYKPAANEKVLLKHAWEDDMQLMSKYLDERVANEIKIKSYMIDHPEFRNMVNDYIHTILLLKPEDIIDFTISHFLSFAPQFMPANDYFSK